MAEPTVFPIENEEQAWATLRRALEEGVDADDLPFVQFKDWPKLEIYLPDTPVEGSISPTMMQAFLELQDTIYRAHTFVESDTGDLRTLSKSERDDLEFRVEVKKGSSGYSIDLQAILEKIATEAIGKMEPTHVVIAAIGIAVVLAGTSVWKTWLNNRAEIRQKELDNEEKKAFLEERKSVAEQDTERFKLLLDAQARVPIIGDIDVSAEKARIQMVKAISEERGGKLMGYEIDPEFGQEITASRRQQSEDIRLSGMFRVAKVDTTVPDGFRVTLTKVEDSTEIVASMQDAMLSDRHRAVIRKAEWDKSSLYVELTARKLRSRIVDAVVVGASEHEPLD